MSTLVGIGFGLLIIGVCMGVAWALNRTATGTPTLLREARYLTYAYAFCIGSLACALVEQISNQT